MNAKVEIVKQGKNGSFLRIVAECTTKEEIEEITRVCRSHMPRTKFLGVI